MRNRVLINDDLIAGLGGTIVLGIGWYRMQSIPLLGIQAGLGPAFFPLLLLILLSVFSGILLLKGIVQTIKELRLHNSSPSRDEKRKAFTKETLQKAMYFIGVFIFPILFSKVGLLISITIFLLVVFIALKINMKIVLLTTLGAVIFFYVFFGLFFNIRML
jgi:uncharacterized membrane protein